MHESALADFCYEPELQFKATGSCKLGSHPQPLAPRNGRGAGGEGELRLNQAAQLRQILDVFGQIIAIWRLQDHWDLGEARVIHNRAETL